ncbi:hypothetical protein BDY21DRAFT_55685 [Lineolata rhizophorae]|uniref:Uncharacterized protein n=1 Tax=Lineolata rhizophorae TaxID=578093 RepID=A0A6A6NXT5_9PEZI|nr:hypothetical protein BDY21DRAFT_55685 [Lineolata rhizophorae]
MRAWRAMLEPRRGTPRPRIPNFQVRRPLPRSSSAAARRSRSIPQPHWAADKEHGLAGAALTVMQARTNGRPPSDRCGSDEAWMSSSPAEPLSPAWHAWGDIVRVPQLPHSDSSRASVVLGPLYDRKHLPVERSVISAGGQLYLSTSFRPRLAKGSCSYVFNRRGSRKQTRPKTLAVLQHFHY